MFGDFLLAVEFVEVELVLESVAELGQAHTDQIFTDFEALDQVSGEFLHDGVIVGRDASRLIQEEDQVGLLLLTN